MCYSATREYHVRCVWLQVAAAFVERRGLVVIVQECLRGSVTSSTLLLLARILHLFARSHFVELLDAQLVPAIGRMLSHQTRFTGDERHLDVEVQHAALMLVLRVLDLGSPEQVCPNDLDFCACDRVAIWLPASPLPRRRNTHVHFNILGALQKGR